MQNTNNDNAELNEPNQSQPSFPAQNSTQQVAQPQLFMHENNNFQLYPQAQNSDEINEF